MERTIKNNGVYVECPVDDMLDRLNELEEAQVIVITQSRIELSGDDKNNFLEMVKRMNSHLMECSPTYLKPDFDNALKSDTIVRKILTQDVPN